MFRWMFFLIILFYVNFVFSDEQIEKIVDRLVIINNKLKDEIKNKVKPSNKNHETFKLQVELYKEIYQLLKDISPSKNNIFLLDESLSSSHLGLSRLYYLSGDLNKAVKEIDNFFTLCKREPRWIPKYLEALAHSIKGHIYNKKSDYFNALISYDKALELGGLERFYKEDKLQILINKVDIFINLKDTKQAKLACEELMNFFNIMDKLQLNNYVDIGWIFLRIGDKKLSKGCFKKAIDLCDKKDLKGLYARLGIYYCLVKDYNEASKYIEKAKKLIKEDSYDSNLQLAEIYYLDGTGHVEKAVDKYENILDIALQKKNFSLFIEIYIKYIFCLERCKKKRIKSYDITKISLSLNAFQKSIFYYNLSTSYFDLGYYKKCQKYLFDLVPILENQTFLNHKKFETYSLMGLVSNLIKDYKVSDSYFDKALVLFHSSLEKEEYISFHKVFELIEYLVIAGKVDNAIQLYNKMDNYLSKIGIRNLHEDIVYRWHLTMIKFLQLKNQHKGAYKLISIALSKSKKRYKLELQALMAESLYNLERYEKAIFYFEKVLKKDFEISFIDVSHAYFRLASSYLYLNEYSKCYEIVLEQIKSSKVVENKFIYSKFLFLLSACQLKLDKISNAIQYSIELKNLSEKIMELQIKSFPPNELRFFLQSLSDIDSLLVSLCQKSNELNAQSLKFNIMKENLIFRLLVSAIRHSQSKNLISEYNDINSEIAGLRKGISYDKLSSKLNEITIRKNFLEKKMIDQLLQSDPRKVLKGNISFDLEKLQKLLNKDQVYLHYLGYDDFFENKNSIGVYVVKNDSVDFLRLGERNSINKKIKKVLQNINNPIFTNEITADKLVSMEKKLKKELACLCADILPVRLIEGKKHLVISLEKNVMKNLPFGCLVIDSKYLVENYDISYIASAISFFRKEKSTNKDFLGVSIVNYKKFKNLKSTAAEIGFCKNIYNERYPNDNLIEKKNTSKDQILKNLSGKRWVHIASHGKLFKTDFIFIAKFSEDISLSEISDEIKEKIKLGLLASNIEISDLYFDKDHWVGKRKKHGFIHLYMSPDKEYILGFKKPININKNVEYFEPQYLATLEISPLNLSTILLNDDFVTAQEILTINLEGTYCFILSICEGGNSYTQDYDQLGFKTLLEFSGVKYSVSAVWQIPSKDTFSLMTRFYKEHCENNKCIYVSLNKAQRRFIQKSIRINNGRSHPYFWAGLVCNGNPFSKN